MSDIIDLIGYSAEGLAGWRYLLSSAYRRRTHARWQSQSKLETGLEILTIAGSFIFVTVVIGAIVWWLV